MRNSDGSVANDTTAVRKNGDIHALRLEGGFNGFIEQGKWHIKGYFYDSEKGLPGAIVSNVWKNSQRQWDRNAFVQGSFQKQLFKNYDFLANVKYSNDFMHYLNPDTTLMYINSKFSQQEIYISTANKYAILPTWDLNFSADYIWNTLDANLYNFVYPTRSTALAALATAFEWRRFKVQASILGTFVFENVRKPNAYKPDDKSEYTPAIFLSYKPFKCRDFNLRTFYKRIFRMPTFNDLYYTEIGNIKLRPEFTTQYNLGFQYNLPVGAKYFSSLQIRADAYYNEVIDKIVATPKGGSGGGSLYRWQMENIGYVEIRGVDVSAQMGWKLPADIHINTSLNYTYQKAQNFTAPKNEWEKQWYGGQINYIPHHSGSAIVNTAWKSWDLNYSFIYVGERYHNSANIRANYEQPWYTHDMTVGKSFDIRNSIFLKNGISKMKISAEINNIFNQQYDVVLNYPMPGRNYKIILKIDI
ncbi:hypothetical protein FACS18945_3100 [Bacteroidia bacterium]|nr:hypothetical protein FACS18945_3100 [Bacteroidia bacterium]